jgi:hypothetical protein
MRRITDTQTALGVDGFATRGGTEPATTTQPSQRAPRTRTLRHVLNRATCTLRGHQWTEVPFRPWHRCRRCLAKGT